MARKKKSKAKPAKQSHPSGSHRRWQSSPTGSKRALSKKKVSAPKAGARKRKAVFPKSDAEFDRPPSEEKEGEVRKRRFNDVEEADGDEVTLDKTPMRIYLQQIEKIPLLTPEEEIDLARKISLAGRDAAEARAKMIRSNLRLVISIAKRYANMGLPFSDLVEEGNIGLMRAVDKFNYKRGYRFSTYASWWIKQGVMRALSNQGKTIRVPVYMFDTISKWRKMREALIQKLSRIPSRKELSEAMGLPADKIKEIERIATQPSSLNAPVSLDSSSEMMDLIQDEAASPPSTNIEELFEGVRIDQILGYVDERERQVLILRFGLKGGEQHTLEETAKHFGVTRERIRQIEVAAITKIREALKTKDQKLEDYVR